MSSATAKFSGNIKGCVQFKQGSSNGDYLKIKAKLTGNNLDLTKEYFLKIAKKDSSALVRSEESPITCSDYSDEIAKLLSDIKLKPVGGGSKKKLKLSVNIPNVKLSEIISNNYYIVVSDNSTAVACAKINKPVARIPGTTMYIYKKSIYDDPWDYTPQWTPRFSWYNPLRLIETPIYYSTEPLLYLFGGTSSKD